MPERVSLFFVDMQVLVNAVMLRLMNPEKRPIVDLVIPARDEAENIGALFDALPRELIREIVLVDNGSTDDTAKLAKDSGATVVQHEQPGYGGACLAGLEYLKGKYGKQGFTADEAVAFIDADLSDDPTSLEKMIEVMAVEGADMVIASRVKLAQPGALTFTQRFGNALACRLIQLTTGARYSDLGPLRIVRWRAMTNLDMQDQTWGWTVEMQYKAAAMGMTWREIDSAYRKRYQGKSKISGSIVGSVRAGSKILMTIGGLWMKGLSKR